MPVTLTALVPIYNESATVEELICRLEQITIVRQIIAVDDASTDDSRAIVDRLAASGRVTACYHPVNRGKGAALRSALALASEPYIAFQDADLEYDPRDFYALAAAIEQHQAPVVYGSRFMGQTRTGMIWTHYLGNRGLTMLFNLLFGQRLTDMETCYKIFRTDVLRLIGIDHDRFDVDPELTAKVVRAGYRIHEVPVSYAGRPYLAGKKIRPRDALTAALTLWRYRSWQPRTLTTSETLKISKRV
jgi:glycosyltransferase involved in cell wall biosynthesis